ncbi:MAG: hypothetical protein SGPRY_014367 [Prymnesium sp.]
MSSRKLFPWMGSSNDNSFTQLDADPRVFVARRQDDILIAAIYVDDPRCLCNRSDPTSLFA